MDFLRQQLITINERLAALSATQKLLTAALAVIVAMTLLYWGRAAASTEMVAVLPGAVTGEEMANVARSLAASNIPYQTNASGQIVVPAARQQEAMMQAAFNANLTGQTVDRFPEMLDKSTLVDTNGKWNAQLNHYHEQRLSQIIGLAPGIASAEVTISQPARVGIARQPPTAHVYIKTKSNESVPRRRMGEGAANVIAASIGIERSKVGVTIDGASFNAADANGMAKLDSIEFVAQMRDWEGYYTDKVRRVFQDIDGLRVDVTVRIDHETKHTQSSTVDPTGKIQLTQESRSESSRQTGGAAASSEPGVMPNVPLRIPSAAVASSGGAEMTSEVVEEKNIVDYNRKQTTTETPAGMATAMSAAIRVPRSYFVTRWKSRNANAGPAEGAAFDAFVTNELEAMRSVVKEQTLITADASVKATEYADIMPADAIATGGPVLAAANAGVVGSFSSLASNHAKDVAVGVLAIASLFMVGRMVKKTAPPAIEPMLAIDGGAMLLGGGRGLGSSGSSAMSESAAVASKMRASANALRGHEDVAGDVMEGGNVMMGQELDPEILETSQMVDQVGGFVKDNPEIAAQLLRRWLSRE